MKKSNLLLCASAAILALASCGGGGSSAPAAKQTLVIWCAEAAVELTTSQVKTFMEQSNLAGNFDFKVNPVGEGDAAGNMITDVQAGADIYFFAQDQMTRLVTAGALTSIGGTYKAAIEGNNVAEAVNSAKVGDKVYAFPATADNGYFLYYDGSKLTEEQVKNWDTLLTAAEGAGAEVGFNYTSAWYNFGFFYGAGADSVWTTNVEGKFTAYADTYNTDKGLVAAKALTRVVRSASVDDNSSIGKTSDKCIAIVDGTWDYKAAKEKWGENLRCAELPNFTVDGKDYHTGSFSGMKFVGVKPQTDEIRLKACLDIANYLTSEEGQNKRFEVLEWGPSNKNAQATDAVKNAPQIVALNKQNQAKSKPQGQFPGKWWDNAGAICSSIKTAEDTPDEAKLRDILRVYEGTLEGMLDVE